jgi:flagellar hook-basal body complex protein FliE
MSIEGIKGGYQHMAPIMQKQQMQGVEKVGGEEKGKGGFGDLLTQAMTDLNQMQLDADDKIEDMVTGNGTVTPHEAMIALEKADVAFQLMNQVRTKIVRAYEEVLRTQV